MPMVPSLGGRSQNDELLGQAAADFGVTLINNVIAKRLNDDRTAVEQQIREAPDYQSALTIIENAPFKVKNAFGEELRTRAQERFPESELISVLDSEGRIASISQERNRPLTDDQIREQGFDPARQFIIISTKPDGELEIHDSALGQAAAAADRDRLQEMFPDRVFQVAEAPETDVFFRLRDQQLRRMELEQQANSRVNTLSPEQMRFFAGIRAEMENDPLVTENGAMVLDGARDTISDRFVQFNSQFDEGIFSLENPESAALVQNGIAVASQMIGRGYNLERAMDIGFNTQIAGSIISDLLKNNAPNSVVAKEGERRFGVNADTLQRTVQEVQNSPEFAQLGEFDPNSSDPDILAQPIAGGETILFIKVNGRLVPFGKQ